MCQPRNKVWDGDDGRWLSHWAVHAEGLPRSLSSKEPTWQCKTHRRLGSIPGSGGSSGVGNGKPLQYSFLENSMDREAWQATVHGLAKSWTQINDWAHTCPWGSSVQMAENRQSYHTVWQVSCEGCTQKEAKDPHWNISYGKARLLVNELLYYWYIWALFFNWYIIYIRNGIFKNVNCK